MPEPDYADQLRVLRPMLKSHIRQTKHLLAVLAELEKDIESLVWTEELRELDNRMAQGGVAQNGNKDRVSV